MNPEYSLLIGIFCAILLPQNTQSQTKFSLTEEKCGGKQEGKKQTPTFVGSDGVERKVSPAAILEEMKRCLPPGLPIPMETAWPQLPQHLEALPQTKDPPNEPQAALDEGFQNLKDSEDKHKFFQEKKRVSRSNDKNVGEMALDVTNDRSMNVKLEGPTKESGICSPKDLNRYKMAEVMKDLLARQMRRQNMTAEYVDDCNVRSRLHKSKHSDDYEDYDYTDPEEPKIGPFRAKINSGSRYQTNSFQIPRKRQRRTKPEKTWKHQKPRKQQMNRHRKKPDYDCDYEESSEDLEKQKYSKHQQQLTSEDHLQSDELEKQIELNDFLERNLHADDGIPERIENIDKFMKKSGHFKIRSGENIDILEGYQKMLAVIMKLNTTLIRLLDKFSNIFQKDPKSSPDLNGPSQREDTGKSSVIWDFMDLLMQQRRGTRNKRENGPYIPENTNKNTLTGDPISAMDGTVIVNSSSSQTNMDLLKWLLKWYLNATSR